LAHLLHRRCWVLTIPVPLTTALQGEIALTNNTNSNYNTSLKHELTTLEARLKRRQALKEELEVLNLEISRRREGVIGLAALAEVDLRQSNPKIFKGEFESALGLTEAILELFGDMDTENGYSVSAIREEVAVMGFPVHVYSNPNATITNALNRLADAGKLMVATDRDTNRAVYLLAEGYGATCLRRRDEEVEHQDRQYTFSGELDEGTIGYSGLQRS
jgi:hypothetical protein